MSKSNYTRELKGNNLLTFLSDYILLDLETTGLDPYFNEIIEVGILKIRDNQVVDKYASLIKPQYPVDDFITELTGITNDMLKNAPNIQDVLPAIFSFIGSDVIVGHNINFDINFLYDNCLKCKLKPLSNDFIDTMRISRKLFSDFRNHRLQDLIERFNITGIVEHRAIGDCMLTYNVYNYMREYVIKNNIDTSVLFKKKSHGYSFSAKDIVQTTDNIDESHMFYGKVFVFTGVLEKMDRKSAMQIVVNLGGICADGVTKKTNFLVLGNNDYCSTIKDGKSTKHKTAEQYILKGIDLVIISENTFYDIIED